VGVTSLIVVAAVVAYVAVEALYALRGAIGETTPAGAPSESAAG
jgi:hypothetical protein